MNFKQFSTIHIIKYINENLNHIPFIIIYKPLYINIIMNFIIMNDIYSLKNKIKSKLFKEYFSTLSTGFIIVVSIFIF